MNKSARRSSRYWESPLRLPLLSLSASLLSVFCRSLSCASPFPSFTLVASHRSHHYSATGRRRLCTVGIIVNYSVELSPLSPLRPRYLKSTYPRSPLPLIPPPPPPPHCNHHKASWLLLCCLGISSQFQPGAHCWLLCRLLLLLSRWGYGFG
jgi:hypothetical protein